MKGIPRKDMPQIDERSIPDLIAFMEREGVKVERTTMPPRLAKPRQRMAETIDHVFPPIPPALAKPVLVSKDNFIIDGDHHWATWIRFKYPAMPIIRFDRNFDEMLELLRRFPETYHAGDGRIHEEDSYLRSAA